MNVGYLKNLLHQYMYHDRATVLRAVKVKVGKTDDFDEQWSTIYENVPSKLSQYGKTLYAHRDDRSQKLTTDLRLTCDPDIEIRPNDYLRVSHQGQIWELVAGSPFCYPTHQEISCRRRKESGQN